MLKNINSHPFLILCIMHLTIFLAKNYDAYSTVILQHEVITEILRLCPSDDITVQTVWENKWLDVEDEYRKNGWEVEYDKPGLGESYPARFIFKPKEK